MKSLELLKRDIKAICEDMGGFNNASRITGVSSRALSAWASGKNFPTRTHYEKFIEGYKNFKNPAQDLVPLSGQDILDNLRSIECRLSALKNHLKRQFDLESRVDPLEVSIGGTNGTKA